MLILISLTSIQSRRNEIDAGEARIINRDRRNEVREAGVNVEAEMDVGEVELDVWEAGIDAWKTAVDVGATMIEIVEAKIAIGEAGINVGVN